ncbi:MAG: hypothetical protein AAFO79_03195, partial [Pseudomonadota bacterium]
IGMGLNLDVDHVAFAGIRKFDGAKHRTLFPAEIAQIGGRAGRHTSDGTFGVTGDVEPFDPELVEKLENHEFQPVKLLQWRNANLDFSSIPALLASLGEAPRLPRLVRARPADDQIALEALVARPDVATDDLAPDQVRMLWETCQIPDYRKVAVASHVDLIASVFDFLTSSAGTISQDWFAEQVTRDHKTDGDIDTLTRRLANMRTWTFLSHRDDWLERTDYWQEKTRSVEDELSDALHEKLTARFVDQRTSALLKRLNDSDDLVGEISDDGAIRVENHVVGELKGFQFTGETGGEGIHGKAVRAAAIQVLTSELAMRVRRVVAAKDDAFTLGQDGTINWRGDAVGQLTAGEHVLRPQVRVVCDEHLPTTDRDRVAERLQNWMRGTIETRLRPLVQLEQAEDISGLAKGTAFQLIEALGILKRETVSADIQALDQTARAQLRRYGVRFGAFNVFLPLVLKPAAAELRMLLWRLRLDEETAAGLPEMPRAGLTSLKVVPGSTAEFYRNYGFHLCGPRAVRVDMLERLSDMVRPLVAWREDRDRTAEPVSNERGNTGKGAAAQGAEVGSPHETQAAPHAQAADPAASAPDGIEDANTNRADTVATPDAATPENAALENATADHPTPDQASPDHLTLEHLGTGSDEPVTAAPAAATSQPAEGHTAGAAEATTASEPAADERSVATAHGGQAASQADTTVPATPDGTEATTAEPEAASPAVPHKPTAQKQTPQKPAPKPRPKGASGDGGFVIQPDMLSILGCSNDELSEVLTALGFRVDRKMMDRDIAKAMGFQIRAPQKPAEKSPADAPGEADNAAAASNSSDPASASASARTETDAATDTVAANTAEPAQDTVNAPTENQPSAATEAEASADQSTEIVVEIWRPRRRGHGGQQQRRRQGDGRHRNTRDEADRGQQTGGGRDGGAQRGRGRGQQRRGGEQGPREGEPQQANATGGGHRARGGRTQSDDRQQDRRGGERGDGQRGGNQRGGGRGNRRDDHRNDRRDDNRRGGGGGGGNRNYGNDRRSSGRDKPIDPDSPFAALSQLKAQLDDGSKGKSGGKPGKGDSAT